MGVSRTEAGSESVRAAGSPFFTAYKKKRQVVREKSRENPKSREFLAEV
jgi:hypothetical protein